MIIRNAEASDAAELARIYRYYVEETAISFELEAPSPEEMERRRSEYSRHYPYIVAEEGGRLAGYAYAHPFSPRAAYRRSVEVTIYLDKDMTGRGYGRALYSELERRLRETGITNLYAIVMYPGEGSVEFHEKLGYRIVGKLTDCGEKFGRLWSVVYMENIL